MRGRVAAFGLIVAVAALLLLPPAVGLAAAPEPARGTVFGLRLTVDYRGIDEATARAILDEGSAMVANLDRLFAGGGAKPTAETLRLAATPEPPGRAAGLWSGGGSWSTLRVRRSSGGLGDPGGWTFSHQSLAVLIDPRADIGLPGYGRPPDEAAFREDLRSLAAELRRLGELKLLGWADFFTITPDVRFYRGQAGALAAQALLDHGATTLISLANVPSQWRTPSVDLNEASSLAKKAGLDLDEMGPSFLRWVDGGEPGWLGPRVVTATRRAQFVAWGWVLAGVVMSAGLILPAMREGQGPGAGAATSLPARTQVLRRVFGLYALAVAAEYWVGILPVSLEDRSLFELLIIALAGLSAWRASRNGPRPQGQGQDHGQGSPGATLPPPRHGNLARSLLITVGLFLAVMAVRLAVYREDHAIFGKAAMVLLVVLWVLHYEGTGLGTLGLSRRRLWLQVNLGLLALLLFRVAEVVAAVLATPSSAVA
ncbi:MAG TPA: hypothetical protein VGL40_12375 [Bacillota bacterium]|jgi:hypothetical protein